jgi:hypothetical protein
MSAPALASGVQPSTLGTLTALGAMTRCLANLMLHGGLGRASKRSLA